MEVVSLVTLPVTDAEAVVVCLRSDWPVVMTTTVRLACGHDYK